MALNETIIMGGIIFLVAVCGGILNILVMKYTSRAKAFQSCFGVLVRFEAAAALVYNCIFGIYAAPTLIFSITSLQPAFISARVGHLAVFSHDVCLLTHFCISLNRFIAAYFSRNYNSIFTVRKTYLYAVLITIMAFAITPFHFFEECWIFFDFKHPSFTYDLSRYCGQLVAFYIQFPRNLGVMIICTILNIATYLKVRIINKNSLDAVAATAEKMRRHKLELALISQVCVQASVYIVQFFTYFIISPSFLHYPWVVFFMTTFAWQMVHVTDGLAVFVFNRDLRNMLAFGKRTTGIVTISVSSRPISTSMKL